MIRICSFALLVVSMLVTPSLAKAQSRAKGDTAAAAKAGVVVNLNTATAADLEQLPGIGAKVAARIVDYRTKKGPFKKVEEIMETSRSVAYSLNKSCSETAA